MKHHLLRQIRLILLVAVVLAVWGMSPQATGSHAGAGSPPVVPLQPGPTTSQSPVINYPNFSSILGLTLNGPDIGQVLYPPSTVPNVLRLTTAGNYEADSVFSNTQIDMTQSFESHFVFNMHSSTSSVPADGIAFVIQKDPRGLRALGGAGGNIGYGSPSPITPSAIVQFDIFCNPENNDPCICNQEPTECPSGQPTASYVGIMQDGDQTNHLANGTPLFSLYGQTINVWVDYDVLTHNLQVFVNNLPTKPLTPLVTHVLTSSLTSGLAYVGFYLQDQLGSTAGDSQTIKKRCREYLP